MMKGSGTSNSIGKLSASAVNDSLINRTIEFIWNSLEPWRNDPTRPSTESEEELNAQFHNFLQAKASREFAMVMFQHEQRQEGRRRVDLSAKPTEQTSILGVAYSIYQPIIVIEGKRLPAPTRKREREYVTGSPEISGGIQRFKLGLHGKDHSTVIIVGYLQDKEPHFWLNQVNAWISELSESEPKLWMQSEALGDFQISHSGLSSKSKSTHQRPKSCQAREFSILHLWIRSDAL